MSTTERPIVEFDHHSREFHDTRYAQWADMRKCPVAFNPAYGGFWVVSGYDEVNTVSRDEDTFSSKYVPEPVDGISYQGIIGVPRMDAIPPAGIAESQDGPHADLRRVINPFLLPPAVERLEPFMEQSATWFLDQQIERGAMDMVDDFTNPVPAVLTLRMLGLPCESWAHYGEVFHAMIAHAEGSPEYASAVGLIPGMVEELLTIAAERRRDPGEDMLSALLTVRDEDGDPMSDDQLISVLWNLIGGGLDTTTSLTSLSLHYLDSNHELRERLTADPSLLTTATEEFLRFFSVNETLTRTVTRDVELGGQNLCRGDRLLLSWLSANRDERMFDRADEIVPERSPNPHLAFGVGPRRCIGMHLARTLFRVMATEVLRRIPDYRVDHAGTRFYQGNPELFGIVHMPVTFSPGPVVGVARPF
jgi:cytochrome P450